MASATEASTRAGRYITLTDLTPSGPEGLFSGAQVDELITVMGMVKHRAVAA